ncbi:TetR family transcriptional regulator [Plantactinospora sp. B5E13]|uniref:TetR/AcrR family transcriptional regulator n=1 Tax=Plantactinospora sp. B5E13 TaxID=3153758 RepID=UPI00325F763B
MPRLADHEQRRTQIIDALLRIAADRGLHAATMRTVAAEAGVTVSTVQYYFHSKEQLLFAALQQLSEAVGRRVAARRANSTRNDSTGASGPLRPVLEEWLGQLIPADAEQRAAYTVFAAYHALALTDPHLAALPYARNSQDLESGLRDLLDRARRTGEVADDRDVDAEAANLLALATGLADSVMAGLRDAEAALRLLRHQLDQVFGTTAPVG